MWPESATPVRRAAIGFTPRKSYSSQPSRPSSRSAACTAAMSSDMRSEYSSGRQPYNRRVSPLLTASPGRGRTSDESLHMTSALPSTLRRTLRRAVARRRARVRRVRGPVGPDAATGARPGAPRPGSRPQPADRRPADSAGHLPRRDRLRRGRRGRHRRARQPRQGPDARGFRGLRGRQAAEGRRSSRRSRSRSSASSASSTSRGRSCPTSARTPGRSRAASTCFVLDNNHTVALRSALVKRAAHEFVDKYLGANDVAAVIHTSRPHRRVAGVHQRSAAAARRRSTSSSARSCARARWSGSTTTTATRMLQPQAQRRRPDRPRRSRSSTRSTSSAATRPAPRSARCAAWPTSWGRSAAGARRS